MGLLINGLIDSLMEKRQQKILQAIIEEYNKTAQPVSSQTLCRKYFFKLSPATIRWEMMALTEQDYLDQPHISAGRVPTDKSYHFFVTELMEEKDLSDSEKKKMEHDIVELKKNQQHFNKKLTEVLAALTRQVSINRNNDDIYEAGLHWLIKEPEFADRESVVGLINSVDSLDQMERIFDRMHGNLQIFIGENDLGVQLRDCSLIAKVSDPATGRKNIIGILGSRRMDYARNISLLDYASQLLDDF